MPSPYVVGLLPPDVRVTPAPVETQATRVSGLPRSPGTLTVDAMTVYAYRPLGGEPTAYRRLRTAGRMWTFPDDWPYSCVHGWRDSSRAYRVNRVTKRELDTVKAGLLSLGFWFPGSRTYTGNKNQKPLFL